MRLTKQMKEKIISLVECNISSPLNRTKEFQNKLQELIYTQEPLLKQFIDMYGKSSVKSHTIFPSLMSHSGYVFNIVCPEKVLNEILGINGTFKEIPQDIEQIKETYRPIFLEIYDWEKEIEHYDFLVRELKHAIYNCNTLNKLRQLFFRDIDYFLYLPMPSPRLSYDEFSHKTELHDSLAKLGLNPNPIRENGEAVTIIYY